jgi:hypothetical protein
MSKVCNPYRLRDEEMVFVTGSRTKKRLLDMLTIQAVDEHIVDGYMRCSMVELVSNGELKHDEERGNSLVVPYYQDGLPYPVSVARSKLEAVQLRINGDNRIYAVNDSVMRVQLGDLDLAINKPSWGKHRLQELLEIYRDMAGAVVSSDSGIAAIPDELYLMSLKIGVINPHIDMSIVENVVGEDENQGIAGGCSIPDALRCGLILPFDYSHLTIIRLDPDPDLLYANKSGKPIGGCFINRHTVQNISVDGVNNPAIDFIRSGFLPSRY